MKNNKMILRLALMLLLANLILLAFLLYSKPKGPNHDRPKKIIIERLEFDAEQIEAYELLIENHRSSIRQEEKQIRELKKALYLLLDEANNGLEAQIIIEKIGRAQVNIEEIHFNHFKDIKALCKEDQLVKFDELSHELARIFSPRPPKPPKH